MHNHITVLRAPTEVFDRLPHAGKQFFPVTRFQGLRDLQSMAL